MNLIYTALLNSCCVERFIQWGRLKGKEWLEIEIRAAAYEMDCSGENKQERDVTCCLSVPLKLFGGLGLVWFFSVGGKVGTLLILYQN